MKGNLHTDELMHEVIAQDTGLRTSRRMSHVFVVDEPDSPRLGFLTDAAINIYPDLETKRDIVQNAIDLARILGWKPESGDPLSGQTLRQSSRRRLKRRLSTRWRIAAK
jgi:phosphotransacetylase